MHLRNARIAPCPFEKWKRCPACGPKKGLCKVRACVAVRKNGVAGAAEAASEAEASTAMEFDYNSGSESESHIRVPVGAWCQPYRTAKRRSMTSSVTRYDGFFEHERTMCRGNRENQDGAQPERMTGKEAQHTAHRDLG